MAVKHGSWCPGTKVDSQAVEMRFLRSVLAKTIRDTVINAYSANKQCTESLNGTVKNTERDRKTTYNE
jgi:hypothetical protein